MESNPYTPPAESLDDSVRPFASIWIVVLLLLVVIVLFASLPLMLTLITLLACNAIDYIVFLILRRTTEANLAFLSGLLMVAALLFTDWGFSTPNPRVRVSWISLIPACISQLALISMPILSLRGKSESGNNSDSAD